MQLDGYRLELNNTILIFTKIDDEIRGKERPFNQTPVWEQAKYYIDFYYSKEQIPDKIPLRKSVEALENKLKENEQLNIDDILSLGVISAKALGQNNSFSNSDSGQFSQDFSSSNSLGSISPAQSSVPTIGLSRVNSTTSLFTNKSNNLSGSRIKKIYTNKSKHTIDVVLSKTDPFLADIIHSRVREAISFRDCVRVSNVTKTEMLYLRDNSQKEPMILGNRVK
jgi:hypothetical protein